MSRPSNLVIFGTASTGELLEYYFRTSGEYKIVAFCADKEYIKETTFLKYPLVPFDEIEKYFSPSEHSFFCAVGQMRLNNIRKQTYLKAKSLGYKPANYISPRADIADNAKIGEHCFIDAVTLYPFSQVGNNCLIFSDVGHHSKIGDHAFIAKNVSMGGMTQIGEQCFVGLNTSIGEHIKIGDRCILGAASVVLQNAGSGKVFVQNKTKPLKLDSETFSQTFGV